MVDEEKDPNFLSGRSKVNSMDYSGAMESFGRALESNPRSASAHKELGWLHYQKFNDYAAAIYHIQQLLRLRPKDPQAEFIRKNIDACKQELARSVFLDPVNEKTRKAFENLSAENLRLKTENTNLLGQVVWLRQQLADRPSPQPADAPRGTSSPALAREPGSAPAAGSSPGIKPAQTPAPQPAGRAAAKAEPTPRREGARKIPSPASQPPSSRSAPAAASAPGHAFSAGPRLHAVRSGESLYAVAKRYGVSVSSLVAANPGINARKLRSGQTLTIPSR
jgi:tetratricopeptide (TPR) repeat protein